MIVVAGFLAVGGLGLIVYGVVAAVTAMRSNGWPVVNGRVTQAQIVFNQDAGAQLQTRQVGLKFEYAYEVDGKQFTGSRLSFGSATFLQKWTAARIMVHYGVETAVLVYYAPHNPEIAILEPGIKLLSLLPIVSGILLLLPLLFPLLTR
jgi:hypothetical protein